MSKYVRWNYDKVLEFVKNNSECKLLTSQYKSVDTKMLFLCKCGNEFETTFYKFRTRHKRQCNDCGRKIISQKQKLSYEEVKHFIEVDSNSGCKLISNKYDNAHAKLRIKCRCGNEFQTKWSHFRNSFQRQCYECGIEQRASLRRLSLTEVRGEIESRGCKLKSEYKTVDGKITIECTCGNEYITSFGLFRDYDVDMCPTCRSREKGASKGEAKIENWLIDNKIKYVMEYSYEELKHTKRLRFDFAIINNNGSIKLLIEYDGKQHFGLGLFTDDHQEMVENYHIIRESDESKNEFCFKNSIPLLRIPYHKYHKIEEILSNTLL